MESVKDNNGYYDVAMKGIEITKTRTYQEVCIYPEKEFFFTAGTGQWHTTAS